MSFEDIEKAVELDKKYEIKESNSSRGSAIAKLLIFSTLGVTFFFVPLFNGSTPLAWVIGSLQDNFGTLWHILAVAGTIGLLVITPFVKNIPFLYRYMAKDGTVTKILYLLGSVFGIMIYFNIGPAWLLSPDTGGLALDLAASVLLTVAIAGFVVTFIANFGFLQVIGTFMEPLMRPLYRLPGYAAVDAVTSIATSPAVDVFLANKIYHNKLYTGRDVAVVVTNFTIVSLGFFVVLCNILDMMEYYNTIVLIAFAISFILPLITARIPPLSRIPNTYIDGQPFKGDSAQSDGRSLPRRAWEAGVETAQAASPKLLLAGIYESVIFAVKVCAYILSIATIALILGVYTPLFTWIGYPMIPILNLLGIPDAAIIAPATLVGISEIALPALIIAGRGVSQAACFFIIVLSTVQVIFFTESANAIMESDIPLGAGRLVVIFLIRTIIAIPLVALAMHLIF